MLQLTVPPACAFTGIDLPICILLNEGFLNVGSVDQLQR